MREFNSTSFYEFLGERKLMGCRCVACGETYLPPRPICPNCLGSEMAWVQMSGQGRLAGFTVVQIAPSAMLAAGYGRDNPYCTGIVQTAEGPLISAQILDVDVTRPETITIGTPLHVAFIQRGEGEQQRTCLAFERD